MFKTSFKFNQDKRLTRFDVPDSALSKNFIPGSLPQYFGDLPLRKTAGIGDQVISGLSPVDIPGGQPTLPEKTTTQGGFKQLPPGIEGIGAMSIIPDQSLVAPGTINDLIRDVRSPDSRVTNLKLPDGLEIGFTPEEALPAGIEGPEVGLFDKINRAVQDPRFAHILAETGKAIAPFSPGVQQIGTVASDLAVGRGLSEFEKVLNEGGDLSDEKFSFIPPELKQQAIQAKLAGDEFDINKKYKEQLIEESAAREAGIQTATEKSRLEDQTNATRLGLGQLSNKYMNIGQGHVLEVETGNVVKAYDYKTGSGGSAVGNLNSSDYRLFNEYATATFLPTAMENRRAEVVEKQGEDFASTIDLISEFKNEDGSTNFQRLMKYLSEEERVQFASQLNEYTNNVARGISPTGTFLQQQIEANTITTPDGKTWRVLPDGSYEEVK